MILIIFIVRYFRINRYMVGCKFNRVKSKRRKDLELIDTWWDVNTFWTVGSL